MTQFLTKVNFIAICLAFAASPIACDKGGSNASGDADTDTDADTDVDTDTDTDTDTDSDTDTDTDTDTWSDDCNGTCGGGDVPWEYNECTCDPSDPCNWSGDGYCDTGCLDVVDTMFNDDADCVANCEPVAWDDVWTYGEDYAPGPYGFKGSMCYPAGGGPCFGIDGDWFEGGDHLPDVCMNNAEGSEVCLKDFYQTAEYDLILVDYTAMWCGPCNMEGDSEDLFLAALEADGWNVLFITILGENNSSAAPSQDDALAWVDLYDLDPAHVLYDADWQWHTDVFSDAWPAEMRGWPTNFFVHPSNMLIWDAFSGWVDPSSTTNWNNWLDCLAGDGLLETFSTNPGAISG